MKSVLRIVAAVLAAYFAARLLAHAPYWELVAATFLAAAVAAAAVRELVTPPPRALASVAPDLITPLVLAGLMLLAVRAMGSVQPPTPVVPAIVWPVVDLWRPLGGRGSR